MIVDNDRAPILLNHVYYIIYSIASYRYAEQDDEDRLLALQILGI